MLSRFSSDDCGKHKQNRELAEDASAYAPNKNAKWRRTRIPDKPPSKICWLTIFSTQRKARGIYEPLTFLQRSAQVYEYAKLLHRAAECSSDPLEEMKRVAGFVLSGYISCSRQKTAPYKSYAGETYELDRMDEFGWRLVSEQVSCEPDTYVQWIEAANWTIQDEYAIETKIRGIEFLVEGRAKGKSVLTMLRSGNKYTWNKLPILVKVRLSGITLEHEGELFINNETTGHKCQLTFHNANRKVTGTIKSIKGETLETLIGNWGSHLKTVDGEILWQSRKLDEGADWYYNFSRFACQLNEPDESVAPTDSRRRLDVRHHEEGSLTASSEAKSRFKSRYVQYRSTCSHRPIWFDPPNAANNHYTWNNKYWTCKQKQDWFECPRFLEE